MRSPACWIVVAALLVPAAAWCDEGLELGPSASVRDHGKQTDVTTFKNTSDETRSITVFQNGYPTHAEVPAGADVTVITNPGSPQQPIIVIQQHDE